MTAVLRNSIVAIRARLLNSRVQEIMVVVAISLLMIAFGETILQSGTYLAATIVVVMAVMLMLIDMRIALFLFIVFLCAYEEFVLSSSEAFQNEGIQGSIQAVRIAGLGLMDFCMLMFLIPVLIKAWYRTRYEQAAFVMRPDIYVLPVAVVWLYGIVLGLFHFHTLSAFAADTRVLGYVLILYFIASRTFTRKYDFTAVVALMYGTVFLKTFLFAFRYFSGGGRMQGYGYYRPLIGSDTALVGFVLALTVGALFLLEKHGHKYRLWLISMIGYMTIILIAGLTRSTFIFTAAAILLQFYLFRSQMKPSIVLGTIGIVMAGGFSFYFFFLSSESRELIGYVLHSAFNWVDALKVYGDMSMGQRILEFINIWGTLERGNMLFLGFGWGSPWSEIIIHHPIDLGAFSIEEQMRGVHTTAHIDAVQFLLKIGIIGMPLLYFFFFRIFRTGLAALKCMDDPKLKFAVLGLSLMIVIFSLNFIYFVRLQFLIGIAFAGILSISTRR